MFSVVEMPVKSWKRMMFRIHPEVHRSLKITSAVEGTTMEVLLHEALCEKLDALARKSGRPHTKRASAKAS